MAKLSKEQKKTAKQILLAEAKKNGLCDGKLVELLAKGDQDANDILLALAEENKLSNDSNERLKELVKNA